ncbi:ribosome silencing factor [Rubrobacter aplysinae]|uniref:ribosome silencing factor n=1 Tax=Rubrobacter aplysinae TaxID=909625 RepID=UPI00069F1A0D|nr:ribosome silencing factor [Rubrobacter aplysinae]
MSRDESTARREPGTPEEAEEVTYHMATTAAGAANGMFAEDVLIMDMREAVSYTDYFVVAGAETERQTRRIADEVIEKMNEAGYRPTSRRIGEETQWVSLDYLDVVVHVFTSEARDFYRLESYWKGVPRERWED